MGPPPRPRLSSWGALTTTQTWNPPRSGLARLWPSTAGHQVLQAVTRAPPGRPRAPSQAVWPLSAAEALGGRPESFGNVASHGRKQEPAKPAPRRARTPQGWAAPGAPTPRLTRKNETQTHTHPVHLLAAWAWGTCVWGESISSALWGSCLLPTASKATGLPGAPEYQSHWSSCQQPLPVGSPGGVGRGGPWSQCPFLGGLVPQPAGSPPWGCKWGHTQGWPRGRGPGKD